MLLHIAVLQLVVAILIAVYTKKWDVALALVIALLWAIVALAG